MVVGNWDLTLDMHAKKVATFISTRFVPPLKLLSPLVSSQDTASISSNRRRRVAEDDTVMRGRDIKGFVYHCYKKGWDLHPCCAALEHEMEVGPEEAKTTLVLHRESSSKCNWCGKKELEKGVKTWTYVSACKECHLHVACVKKMLLEQWEIEHLGHRQVAAKAEREDSLALKAGRKDSLALKVEGKDSLALKISEPTTQIVPQKKKSNWGKFAKFKKIVQIAITFIMAAVVGDPTTLVAGLIASLIDR